MVKNSLQVRTFGVAHEPPFIYDERQINATAAKIRRKRCFKCCGCTALVLIILATVIVLGICRDPILHVGNINVGNLDRGNVTLNADVWVSNPNFATIEYGNMTTTLYYRGVVVGESRAPPGTARARRTVMINAAVDIMADRFMSQPDLDADMLSGLVNVSSYTRVGGKINLGIFEKELTMKMRCNASVNVTSKMIQQHKCKRKIKLFRLTN